MKLFYYPDRLTCLRFTPRDDAIRFQTKTIKLWSFLKTEQITGGGISEQITGGGILS
jgi:hypothetical protein